METRYNLRKIALLAGAALLSTSAFAATFMDGTVTRTETVKYSVLDASTYDGAATLYQKLHEAALRVCGQAEAPDFLPADDAYDSCVSSALSSAVARVGIPMVSVLHQQSLASTARKAKDARLETMASR